MIPKILHQTAKTAQISERERLLQEKVRSLHPDWEYRFWTDQDNLALIKARHPRLESVYHALPKSIMRADLARYVLMDLYGGLYLDLDYEFLKPFDLNRYAVVLPRESDDSQPVYLGNSVLASEPGHPIWKALLESFQKTFHGFDGDVTERAVIDITGPGLVTSVYGKTFNKDPGIYVPPRAYFNPPIPSNDEEYRLLKQGETTYGIHYCFGSWRALTKWQRLLERFELAARRLRRRFSRGRTGEHRL